MLTTTNDTQAAPQPLCQRNGIPEHLSTGFIFDGVPMRFFGDAKLKIVTGMRRLAPFFCIDDGSITAIDWKFFKQACSADQDIMVSALWAAGILTKTKLGSFAIKRRDDEDSHVGPEQMRMRLYFAAECQEFAEEYLSEVLDWASAYEIAQCIELAKYLTLRSSPLG